MEDANYSIVDMRFIGNVSIELRVAIGDDFETYVGKRLENFGDITISPTSTDRSQDECFWDNLNFFLNAPLSEVKKECKKELIKKDLHEKGVFKLIKEMLKPFVKRGFLKIRKGEGY